MPTPRPFGAPTTFTPRFTPQGLLQRAQAEVNSQVARMRNLAGRGFGPFPSDGPIGPRPRPTAPVGLPAAGNLLNQIGRGATGIGALMYGTEVLKPFLRSAGILPRTYSGVGSIPPRDRTGESYRDAELRLSAAARAAGGPSAGGGIGGGNAASYVPSPIPGGASGSPAAERAYQSEASRVAQMTAQNPDLQRYEAARQAAVAPGATPEQVQSAEDIGMRIWAEKYGKTLAPKVKPGQAGYDVIQGVLNTGKMGAPLDLPFNPSSVLSTEPVPASAEYGATAPAALPPEAALAANAFSNVQPGMFQRYRDQSALEVSPLYDSTISPLGTTPPLGALNYGGAVQPIGGNVVDEAFRGDKARQLAEMFKNAILTGNR